LAIEIKSRLGAHQLRCALCTTRARLSQPLMIGIRQSRTRLKAVFTGQALAFAYRPAHPKERCHAQLDQRNLQPAGRQRHDAGL
jgi:hypothetical protein